MNEMVKITAEQPDSEKDAVKKLLALIDSKMELLVGMRLKNLEELNKEYLNLPDDLEVLENFYARLQIERLETREDALMSIEFSGEFTEAQKDKIRRFDREVRAAYRDHENFLGNGATAEVYALSGDDKMCVKFITDQDRYDENNHLRIEFTHLSKLYKKTKESVVRVPYPIFLRIHSSEGHSYGMEKIRGASLSQILENPAKYPKLVALAKGMDRSQIEENLNSFIIQMHDSGLVHGDLYARNLMFDEEGRLFVIDLGKAQVIDFPGGKEDERKRDLYTGRHSLIDFFTRLNQIDNNSN